MLQYKPHERILNAGDEAFAQDAYDLFAQKRAGHMSKWLYSTPLYEGDKVRGADAFVDAIKEAQNGSPYYVFLKEREIIAKFSSKTAANLFSPNCRIIDLGPGSADSVRHKIVPLIEVSKGKVEEYVAVDVCGKTLDIAKEQIRTLNPELPVQIIKKDFIEDSFSYGVQFAQEISTMFGLTLCNMAIDPRVTGLPEHQLAACLRRLKSHLTAHDAHLIITQDTNQNQQSLKTAYSALEEHYLSFLHRIARDLDIVGDYTPENFIMDVEYLPDTQACAISIVAQKPMMFSIGEKIVTVHKNDRFYFHNAFKFDEKTFLKAAQKAGFNLEHTERSVGNPCLLHVLQAQ